jgi:hypothetical protein
VLDNVRIAAFLLIWMGCWFGGWIAGGPMFPAYEVPAMVGAFLGFWIGLFGAGLLTRIHRLSPN